MSNPKFFDRVKDTSITTGTGTLTLSNSAPTGFRTWGSVLANNETGYYCAFDASGNWEIGIGTYGSAGHTLARTTILASSNSNLAVSFASPGPTVFMTLPAGLFGNGSTFASTPSGQFAFGPEAELDTYLCFPGFTGRINLVVSETLTGTYTTDFVQSISGEVLVNPAVDCPDTVFLGGETSAFSDPSMTKTVDSLAGFFTQAVHQANVNIGGLIGSSLEAFNTGDGNLSRAYAVRSQTVNSGSGTINTAYLNSGLVSNDSDGHIGTAYAYYSYIWQSGSGTIGDAYTFYADYSGGTGHTNVYGFYCADMAQTPSSGQNWNFFSQNVTGNAKNFFGGKFATDQTAAATTPGTVVKKMPIYDAAGALLGYIPIYNAIT